MSKEVQVVETIICIMISVFAVVTAIIDYRTRKILRKFFSGEDR